MKQKRDAEITEEGNKCDERRRTEETETRRESSAGALVLDVATMEDGHPVGVADDDSGNLHSCRLWRMTRGRPRPTRTRTGGREACADTATDYGVRGRIRGATTNATGEDRSPGEENRRNGHRIGGPSDP